MKQEVIIALLQAVAEKAVQDHIDDHPTLRGRQGPRGIAGSSFEMSEHRDTIVAELANIFNQQSNDLKLKFSDLTEKDVASLQGPIGSQGKAGRNGIDFIFEDHAEAIDCNIREYVNSIVDSLKLKLSDLSDEEIIMLTGPKGLDGRDAIFEIEDHAEFISDSIASQIGKISDTLKLKFSDLSDEEKLELRGPRGQKGSKGSGFIFEDCRAEIESIIQENKLKFSDLTPTEIESITGPQGVKGSQGESFKYADHEEEIRKILYDNRLKFSDLTHDQIDSLKLRFDNLSDDERLELRGPRGQKGSRGSQGDQGIPGIAGAQGPQGIQGDQGLQGEKGSRGQKGSKGLQGDQGPQGEKGDRGDRGLLGPIGLTGVQGPQGAQGPQGVPGYNGYNGLSAPIITDIKTIQTKKDRFKLKFIFSDSTIISTDAIFLPISEQLSVQYLATNGGGGISEIIVSKDGSNIVNTTEINFVGDNINVTDVEGVATVSVESSEPIPLKIYDEGLLISNLVTALDFVGDGVYIKAQTTLGDWVTLDDVTSLDMDMIDPSTVQVVIDGVAESANYLVVYRTLDEAMTLNKLVSASSGSNIVIASKDVESKARVLGLLLEAGSVGDLRPVLLVGNRLDNAFNFGLNKALYLNSTGGMQEITPTTGWVTPVAFSNGAGSVFIQPKEPMEIL